MNKKVSLWERYLTREIGIEFKSCLYFFAILFYYCMYRLVNHTYTADILHMTEMILLCYVIGYAQVYLFHNFDEAWRFGTKEILGIIVCTAVYTVASYLFGWLGHSIGWTIGFLVYILLLYICVIFIYDTKRKIDDKELNKNLELFQARREADEDEI
ncbi:MAG: DUF3021 family protein [Pseudobutyrivibrio sp.]|nr:DUF3021 family protein [Pseudobutyrivibrio sp.]